MSATTKAPAGPSLTEELRRSLQQGRDAVPRPLERLGDARRLAGSAS